MSITTCIVDQATCDAVRLLCEDTLYWNLNSIRWLGAAGLSASESCWETTVTEYFAMIPAFIRGIMTSWIRAQVCLSEQVAVIVARASTE